MTQPEAVILFGASGFVGRNLSKALAGQYEQIIGVTNTSSRVEGCTRVVNSRDLNDSLILPRKTVAIHVAAFRYDAVNFADSQSDILVANARLYEEFFHFCAMREISEVRLASSMAVYDARLQVLDDAIPIDLNSPSHPREAFYSWSKRWSEVLAQLYAEKYGLNTIVFRLSNPYGPYDSTDVLRAHVLPAFIMKALSEEPTFEIRGDPGVSRDFVYVGDVAEVFRRSLFLEGHRSVFNLCSGKSVTLVDLARTIMSAADVKKEIVTGQSDGGPRSREATSTRLRAQFDLSPRPVSAGIVPTIEWYRNAI
jgi:nucleoside-diphosphate-sugar epimerase